MSNKIISKILKIKWKKWGTRRYTLRVPEHFALCSLNSKKLFGLKFPEHLFLAQNETCYAYLNEKREDEYLKEWLKKIYSQGLYDSFEKSALPYWKEYLEFSKQIPKQNLSKLNNQKLLGLLEEFIKKEDLFTARLWVVFVLDEFLSQNLEKELEKHFGKKEIGNYLKIILSPEQKSAVFKQTLDILNLAQNVKTNKVNQTKVNSEIQKITDRYSYFPIYNFDERPLSRDYFKKELKKILQNKDMMPKQEAKRINNQFKQNKEEYKKLAIKLKSNLKLLRLAKACHSISYLREYRNDIRRESYFYARELYKEIARRLKMSFSNLLFLTRHELKSALKKSQTAISVKELESRRKYYAMSLINEKMHYIFDHQIVKKLFQGIESRAQTKDFRGLSACPGKVIGKAKVIINAQKGGLKFKEDDILITSMTNLDFVPLISKAAAIITDEGGLLCHAAIIARELKKPCIVGTKIATKVLKDGDLIEVNANHGLVKIIKR